MKQERRSTADRLGGAAASLLFSIPTAVLLWLVANAELGFWGGSLDTTVLLAMIAVLSVVGFVAPELFPRLIGAVWRGMLRVGRWLGW